jgi:hypothetical protein
MQLLIEKNVLTIGEPIKVILKARGDETMELRLYVMGITSLLDMERGSKIYRNILNKSIVWKIKGGEHTLTYPSWLPPSLGLKTLAIKWTLVSGVPRLRGKILFPRREMGFRVYPAKPTPPNKSQYIIIDKLSYKPGETIKGIVKVDRGKVRDMVVELLITEYLKIDDKTYSYTYQLSSAEVNVINNETCEFTLKIPEDETLPSDRYIFYPYTFESRVDDKVIGVKCEVNAEIPNEFSEKQQIILEPHEIKFKKIMQPFNNTITL